MYRLLIVDDEPIITDAIYDAFTEFDGSDLDVCKAYSGSEALDFMKRAKVDIVVSDICMPDISGLDVQREIRARWPGCKVIFLTGMDDFNYIQSAMRNDGVDYVLKKEGTQAIYRAVEKAIDEIGRDSNNKQQAEKARKSLELAMPILRGNYLSGILRGDRSLTEDRIKQFNELDMPLRPELSVLLVVGRIDDPMSEWTVTGRMKVVYDIQSIMDRYFAEKSSIVPVVCESLLLVWFIQPEGFDRKGAGTEEYGSRWEGLAVFTKETVGTVQIAVSEHIGVTVSFMTGEGPVSWEEVPERFSSMKAALDKASGLGNGLVLVERQGQEEGFLQAGRVLKFICEYIELHLDGDLSLTRFGEMLHFHPFYISRLFKRMAGRNLSEYISAVKFKKAKELLRDPGRKIQEITQTLGFETPSYFTKFFKRYTGLTPSEYRDSTME